MECQQAVEGKDHKPHVKGSSPNQLRSEWIVPPPPRTIPRAAHPKPSVVQIITHWTYTLTHQLSNSKEELFLCCPPNPSLMIPGPSCISPGTLCMPSYHDWYADFSLPPPPPLPPLPMAQETAPFNFAKSPVSPVHREAILTASLVKHHALKNELQVFHQNLQVFYENLQVFYGT